MQRAQQLGRYHLLDRIAFGGMAEIYRAKTFDGDGHVHMVAVKRVLAHLAEDDDFIQMIVDEAKIASLLRHNNIARIYEFARAQGEYFIAMEHVDGKDVRTILERCRQQGKSMPAQHAVWIAGESAAALHGAHTARDTQGRPLQVVHRDISPSNMICAYTGEVKLCDFGIAKATLSKVHTKTGVIKGKVKYMSPEQAMGRKLDHRSDIFSLGSVLYELLTRTPPFVAPNEMDLLIKVRDAKYRPVRELEPETPPELERIVDRALARSRSARYQSAEEMRVALKEFQASFAPTYSRSHLGRFLRRMFEAEIDKELRQLEEYVLDDKNPVDVGENLIADVMGPNAEYSNFMPIATGASKMTLEGSYNTPEPGPPPKAGKGSGGILPSQTVDERRPRRTPPAKSAPPVVGNPEEVDPVAARLVADAHPLRVAAPRRSMARAGQSEHAGSPGGRDPRELDPAVHEAPTGLIRPPR